MTRSLLFIVCALFSTPVFSAIEIAQWLPWSFIQQKLIPSEFEISRADSFDLEASSLRQRINFTAHVKGRSQRTQFHSAGISASHQLEGVIEIDAISIDQWILRNINGNIFRVYVKVSCRPFSLRVNKMSSVAEVSYQEERGLWVPDLQDLSLHISEWSLSEIECSGVGGVADEIRRELTGTFNSPERFQDFLRENLGVRLSQYFLESWESLLSSTSGELSDLSMDRPGEKGLIIRASLKNHSQIPLTIPLPDFLSDRIPQFIISKSGFEALIQSGVQKMIPQNYDLQNVEGFRGLMASRIKQFLVWPDLMRFPKKNPFYFSPQQDQSQLKLVRQDDGIYQAMYNANAMLSTPINGALIDYMQIGIGLETTLSVSVKNGHLLLKAGWGRVNVAWEWGLLYQLLYNPKKRIAQDILFNALRSMTNGLSFRQELPVIRMNDKEYKLENFRETNNIITMDWL